MRGLCPRSCPPVVSRSSGRAVLGDTVGQTPPNLGRRLTGPVYRGAPQLCGRRRRPRDPRCASCGEFDLAIVACPPRRPMSLDAGTRVSMGSWSFVRLAETGDTNGVAGGARPPAWRTACASSSNCLGHQHHPEVLAQRLAVTVLPAPGASALLPVGRPGDGDPRSVAARGLGPTSSPPATGRVSGNAPCILGLRRAHRRLLLYRSRRQPAQFITACARPRGPAMWREEWPADQVTRSPHRMGTDARLRVRGAVPAVRLSGRHNSRFSRRGHLLASSRSRPAAGRRGGILRRATLLTAYAR